MPINFADLKHEQFELELRDNFRREHPFGWFEVKEEFNCSANYFKMDDGETTYRPPQYKGDQFRFNFIDECDAKQRRKFSEALKREFIDFETDEDNQAHAIEFLYDKHWDWSRGDDPLLEPDHAAEVEMHIDLLKKFWFQPYMLKRELGKVQH